MKGIIKAGLDRAGLQYNMETQSVPGISQVWCFILGQGTIMQENFFIHFISFLFSFKL